MPRPIRLRKPPSAPSATTTAATATATTATKKVSANTTKSRTTRSGIKDIPDQQSSASLLTPSSDDVPTKKPSTKPAVAKRSTRSKVPTNEPVASPSPRKQPTTRIRKSTKAVPEVLKEATPTPLRPAPSLSPLPPSSPDIQVPASSDAENHSPRHFASSPPPLLSTPPRTKRRVVLEFDSDAGYSPPPTARPTSAERPRLRELQPVSLEPFDSLLPENVGEGNETDDTIDPRASPTPKRGRKLGFTSTTEDYDEEPPTSAQPPRRALLPPTGGVGFFIDGEESEFIIYSDPGSPAHSLPPAGIMDDNMRPPESSPAPTPVKQRKRRSSGAVVDSDEDDGTDSQDETELAAGRGGKKRKGKAAKEKQKVRLMPTSALMELLPRRKRNTRTGPVDEFDILSTSEENQEDDEDTVENGSEDELSKPSGRNTRSGRGAKKPAAKAVKGKGKILTATSGKGVAAKEKGKGKVIAPAAVTKNAWSKPLSGRPGKTYARRSTGGSEKENDSPNKVRGGRDQVEKGSDGNSSDTIVIADGIVEKTGRRKLKEVVEKFKEVDRWEMEFEDLSPRSLEVGSEASGR